MPSLDPVQHRSTLDGPYLVACGLIAAVVAWGVWTGAEPERAVMPDHRCEVRGVVEQVRRVARQQWSVLIADGGLTTRALVAAPVLPGDELALRGVCTPPPGFFTLGSASPSQRGAWGRYDQTLLHAQVMAMADGRHVRWRRPWARLADRVYELVVRHGARADATGLLLGLVLGNPTDILETDLARWRDLGVVHALSVSGLHLGLVAMLVFWLGTRLAIAMALVLAGSQARARWLAHGLTATALVAYAALTGMQTATARALVMALLMLGASAKGRSMAPWRLLMVCVAGMLAWHPAWILDPSFQLSVVATGALVASGPWFVNDAVVPLARSWPRRAIGRLAKAIAISAWVALATAPITAYHFHQVPLASVIANLLVTVPCELIALPLALLGVVVAPLADGLAGMCLALAEQGAAAALIAARWLAPRLPTLECAPPTLPVIAAYAAACALAWAAVRARVRRMRFGLAAALMAALAATMAMASASRGGRASAMATLSVTFLDVGQGDAALVEFPGGARWLVDAGRSATTRRDDPAYDPLLRYLRARRIRKIDRVIITHRHADHFAALCHLAGRIAIGSVWQAARHGDAGEAAAGEVDQAFARCVGALRSTGTVIETPRLARYRGASLGDAEVAVVGPRALDGDAARATAEAARDENDNSIIILMSFAGRRFALLGDAAGEQEPALVDGMAAVDVVKIGHHGSATSSMPALVARLRPQVAIVSVGRGNRFGLPARDVLLRWSHRGARMLRTDLHGTISVVIAADGSWRWFSAVAGVVALP